MQALAIATIFTVSWLASLWLRRRFEADRDELPRRALPPRTVGFTLGIAPYAVYGALLFIFVFAPKLLAGGILDLHYRYGPVYEGATDLAMLVLIPALIAVHRDDGTVLRRPRVRAGRAQHHRGGDLPPPRGAPA